MLKPVPFFDKTREVSISKTHLPHWEQLGATYFLTFRLADSIPTPLLRQWEEERERWKAAHPIPWDAETETAYHREFSARVDRWLDAGHGGCLLRIPDVRSHLVEVLEMADTKQDRIHSFVIMPNHVHLLASLQSGLKQTLSSWKSIPAHKINKAFGMAGALWQEGYFDRLVRDQAHFANCVRYIRRNPEKAKLGATRFTHYESLLATQLAG